MKKKKILFDATIISDGYFKNNNRSGMFFATFNILKELLKYKELDISLYCAPTGIKRLQYVLQNSFSDYSLKIFNECEASIIGSIQNKIISAEIENAKKYSKIKLKILKYLSLFFKVLAVMRNRLSYSRALRKHINEFDVFLSLGYVIPKIVRTNNKIKRYTFIYDAIPLLYAHLYTFSRYFGYSWVKTVINHLNADDYCFSISEQTKQDFLKFCPKLLPEKITVTPLAASNNFYQCLDPIKIEEVKKKYSIPSDKKYIFSLCTIEPRKNLLFSIKCFIKLIEKNEIYDLVFVLGGGFHKSFIDTFNKELNGLGKFKNTIIKPGYIDDEDLASLYSNAEFFVYPSLYEGFGLPPLEAMQCGTPVITSNTSSLPEVVSDAGILIDPQSKEELIAAMEELYFNKDLRENLSTKGIERAKLFSWEKCVDIMVSEMLKEN